MLKLDVGIIIEGILVIITYFGIIFVQNLRKLPINIKI